MSSPRRESSSRIWWPLSRYSTSVKSEKALRRSLITTSKPPHDSHKQSGVKFNTFVSAIGFKSKKHPSLTIQEPPPNKHVEPPNIDRQGTPRYANRPPSKSVSSTLRSSLELRTPSDGPRDPLAFRQSLMTLSDDPFAARGIAAPGTQDPTRLSVYCNFSPDDKKQEALTLAESYASFSGDSWSLRPISSPSDTSSQGPLPNETQSIVRRKKPSDVSLSRPKEGVAENGRERPEDPTINRSHSLSTLTSSRLSHSDPTPLSRPPMRTRGMTETKSNIPRLKFLQHSHAPSEPTSPPSPSLSRRHSRPRVLVRQPSSSRVVLPPSAPPVHDLPPPPGVGEDQSSVIPPEDLRCLSPGMSFASSVPSEEVCRSIHETRENGQISERTTSRLERDWGRHSPTLRNLSTSTLPQSDATHLTLKKAASHQSLIKRGDTRSASTPPLEALERVPRKQRSFHHQRLPMPPIPSTSSPSHVSTAETRRVSTCGHSSLGRKRLFSGSNHRRPSTSQSSTVDDDVRSMSSLPLESGRAKTISFSNALSSSTASVHSSFWDEGATDPPSSPISSTRDYTPQQIMSPAEMLRVEASFQQEESFNNYGRPRDVSFTSVTASTPDTFVNDYSPMGGLSSSSSIHSTPASILKPARLRGLSLRSSSAISRELPVPHLDVRPSTSQSHTTPPTSPNISSCYPCQPVPIGLSPPRPRSQPRPPSAFSTQPDRSSFVPIIPLSPPPLRRNLRTQASGEMARQRQSLMRKPSFLEIEDDTGKNVDKPSVNSFLDLNRESFDTVRSMEYSDDE